MEPFVLIFDHLEFSNCPTLRNVIPSYYKMASYCEIKESTQQKEIIDSSKAAILNGLDDKYWNSITILHWIATYLEPTFKSLNFILDRKDPGKRYHEIERGLHVLASDILSRETATCSPDNCSPDSCARTIARRTIAR